MAVDHASAANFGFARLVGHAFGCETDARAASRSPVDVYAYGYLHIAEPPFFRTIMDMEITEESVAETVASYGFLGGGECERVAEKMGGIAVHTGARVMAQAQPGEVLVSSTVKDLVSGSGLTFAERGSHRLKGIPGEWSLFAVA